MISCFVFLHHKKVEFAFESVHRFFIHQVDMQLLTYRIEPSAVILRIKENKVYNCNLYIIIIRSNSNQYT